MKLLASLLFCLFSLTGFSNSYQDKNPFVRFRQTKESPEPAEDKISLGKLNSDQHLPQEFIAKKADSANANSPDSTSKITTEYQNFLVGKKQFYYTKFFKAPTKAENDLPVKLFKYLSSETGLSEVKLENNIISGKIDELSFDTRKYGNELASSGLLLTFPVDGKFTIQFKGSTYSLLIWDMAFTDPRLPQPDGNSLFTRQDKTLLATNPEAIQAMSIMDKQFEEIFKLNERKRFRPDW
ncbi:hypothetical protein [Adhaeribacter aquaticus]|uniref:hypothetical protein n=1 Tax=Adhaeribacter aquaticus TaxID=299567 RepID=UPI000403BAFE|nr:hypothetical protein [Adhaeribacter aquaticus]